MAPACHPHQPGERRGNPADRSHRGGWARYDEGIDEQGNPIDVVDRLKDSLMLAASRQRQEPLSFISQREVFGGLIDNQEFVAAYTSALTRLHTQGARATVQSLES